MVYSVEVKHGFGEVVSYIGHTGQVFDGCIYRIEASFDDDGSMHHGYRAIMCKRDDLATGRTTFDHYFTDEDIERGKRL